MLKILLSLFFTVNAFALTDVDRAELAFKNIIVNSGFESGKGGWTASGGDTITHVTSGTNLLIGKGSLTWDSAGAGRILTHQAVTIPKGLYAGNGLCSYLIQVPSGTATHLLRAYDGVNVIASQTIVSMTTPVVSALNFQMPSSGTVQCQLVSVNANEPLIAIDSSWGGAATNLREVNQATIVGVAKIAGTSNCRPSRTSATMGAFTADTDCPGPTVIQNVGPGIIQTTDTDLPRFTVNGLQPGTYLVRMTFPQFGSNAGENVNYTITDGTTSSPSIGMMVPATQRGAPISIEGFFTYSTAGNKTFEIYGSATVGSANIDLDGVPTDLEFSITRFPTAAQTVFYPETYNWLVDATITGANPSLGTTSVTSYTEITDASLTLVNEATGNLTAQIPCSTTNASSGTTCSAGSESVGVAFTIPTAGSVEACVSFSHDLYVDTSTDEIQSVFQIVETPNNAQTISQEGKSKVQSGTYAAAIIQNVFPHRLCGTFAFTSAGQKTLRLMYEQSISGTITSNMINADANANYGQRNIHWTVRPINQSIAVPVLVGSVTNSGTGTVRTEAANINCDSGSAITSQLNGSSWVSSVGNISGGTCAITFATGAFTSAPYCVVTGSTANSSPRTFGVNTVTSSGLNVDCIITSIATDCTAEDFNIVCVGAK